VTSSNRAQCHPDGDFSNLAGVHHTSVAGTLGELAAFFPAEA
jgi:hypothetical protein